ncbi:hypothetical protein M434DRAFT_39122 [Hypoxylon sp. CO27-5]|nr:hypothetical protein M434DRAFT_39122 [Hypoxylon sp. CO27-5]
MSAPPPDRPQIAHWPGGPHPFRSCISVPGAPGDYRVNLGSWANGNRVESNLERICQWGSGNKITTASLLNESEIWILMNAFNFNTANSFSNPWTWVSQYFLDIPNMQKLPRGFTWETWEQPARINTFNQDLLNELAVPWLPVRIAARREGNYDPMYRFIVFMHRHHYPLDRSSTKSLDRVYSMTVFDRENESSLWYDFWPHGDRELRWSNVHEYWSNIPFNWPAPLGGGQMADSLKRARYTAVNTLEAQAYQRFPAAYTQYIMIQAMLRLMNYPDVLSGRPRHVNHHPIENVPSRLSGVHEDYTPRLIFVLFQTLRLSTHARPDLKGNDNGTRQRIEATFKVLCRTTADMLREHYLEPAYGNKAAERWIIRALAEPEYIYANH